MRIAYLTLLLIVLLNFGNPCEMGLRHTPNDQAVSNEIENKP